MLSTEHIIENIGRVKDEKANEVKLYCEQVSCLSQLVAQIEQDWTQNIQSLLNQKILLQDQYQDIRKAQQLVNKYA